MADISPLRIRRVVTGHDAEGRSIVISDGIAEDVISERALQQRALLWATRGLPVDNGIPGGGKPAFMGGSGAGTVFGIVQLEAGIASKPHRTVTIDYGIVLSGRLGLRLADGEVFFNPGDMFVQRGTIRDWINHGPGPCVMAVAMITAEPLEIGGKILEPVR